MLPPGGVSVSAEWLRDAGVCPLMGKQDLAPRLLLIVPPWSLSPPFPNEQLLESAHWGSGKVMEAERWLFPIIKETGDKERLGAQEPHRALHGIDKQRTEHPANYSCLLKSSHLRMCVCSVAQSCPTLCDPVDCSLPGSPVHGIVQARILEWIAISYFRGSSQLRDRTLISCISCIGRRILYH